MPSLTLFPKSTALVLIDLQKGITGLLPDSSDVVLKNASRLADRFPELNAPVCLVRVAFSAGPAALNLITDAKAPLPAAEPEGWDEPALKPQENDIFILKRHWGRLLWHRVGSAIEAPARRHDRNRWNSDEFWRRIDCSHCL
ncbi:MAG TPA: isochorismatase family protein [Chthoniobacterales bacterium]|nr:isochorismatase family protein [Chthoniobacterales bacterium]